MHYIKFAKSSSNIWVTDQDSILINKSLFLCYPFYYKVQILQYLIEKF